MNTGPAARHCCDDDLLRRYRFGVMGPDEQSQFEARLFVDPELTLKLGIDQRIEAVLRTMPPSAAQAETDLAACP